MKKLLSSANFALIIASLFLISCKKDISNSPNELYGNWKTSYGDTINFGILNSKNTISYNQTMNVLVPMRTTQEYIFQNEGLGIKNGMSGTANFHFYKTFRWIQERQIFEIQGVEWFNFLSSTQTYFTFSKLP